MPSVQGGAAYPVALYDSQGNPLITSGGGLPTTITGPLGATTKSQSLSVVPASDYQSPIVPVTTQVTWTNITALNGDGVAAMDASVYRSFSLTLFGTWSATVRCQVSPLNDGANWYDLRMMRTTDAFPFSGVTAGSSLYGSIPPNMQIRVRATAFSSGTINGTFALSSLPLAPQEIVVNLANQNGTGMPSTSSAYGTGDASSGNISLPPVATFSQLANGTTWDRERAVSTTKTAQSSATASGSALDVWTPAAGKKFRLRGGVVSGTIAGRYEIRDSTGTVIAYLRLVANTPFAFALEANGYISAANNNVLKFYNQSGSASDLDAWVWGNEE